MFPNNKNMHTMETRKREKYKVDHANTERLKTYSIKMSRKLNLFNEYTYSFVNSEF